MLVVDLLSTLTRIEKWNSNLFCVRSYSIIFDSDLNCNSFSSRIISQLPAAST